MREPPRMATKTIQTCDVCGANASTTATIMLDRATTEIDLCAKHAKELEGAVKGFVGVGRTVGRSRAVARKSAPVKRAAAKKAVPRKTAAKRAVAKKAVAKKASTKGRGRRRTRALSQVAEMRAWGYANGFNVASKGRLKPDLVAAYEAANK